MGKVAADEAAEWEQVVITLPPPDHIYTVSVRMTRPELIHQDGRYWSRYQARVLDRVTVVRRAQPENDS